MKEHNVHESHYAHPKVDDDCEESAEVAEKGNIDALESHIAWPQVDKDLVNATTYLVHDSEVCIVEINNKCIQ